MKFLVPLAEGFEEIEAVTIIDILRRAEINVVTAALKSNPVTGSHNIKVTADIILGDNEQFDAIILPGGIPGSINLKNDARIINLLKTISKAGGITAAICAAPIVLAEAGLLAGKKFTCYPGHEEEITGGRYIKEPVVTDGQIITSMGAACSPLFAFKIVENVKGQATATQLKEKMMSFW